jgi:C4-type Zn-finger protein
MKVTGDPQKIEEERSKINNQVQKLVNFNKDIFNENYKTSWKECFRRFNESIIGSDNGVKMLIEETFSESLTSSESAFDLLSNF